jgi:hypothetical protein
MTRLDACICIDEKEDFAAGDACAGIAHGCNLPAIHRDDTGAKLLRDYGRRIGRTVVYHNQLVRFLSSVGGALNGTQSFRQFVFLVMCGDDERQFRRPDAARAGGATRSDQMPKQTRGAI